MYSKKIKTTARDTTFLDEANTKTDYLQKSLLGKEAQVQISK